MAGDGDKEASVDYGQYTGLGRRTRTPLFEKDILTPSPEAMEAISQSYFPDENDLTIACQYLAWLELFSLEDEVKIALYKINGNKAIQARSLRYAVQAHGGLYWPDNTSKDEKKFLAKQFKDRNNFDEGKDDKRE